jgi:hypothetical protein
MHKTIRSAIANNSFVNCASAERQHASPQSSAKVGSRSDNCLLGAHLDPYCFILSFGHAAGASLHSNKVLAEAKRCRAGAGAALRLAPVLPGDLLRARACTAKKAHGPRGTLHPTGPFYMGVQNSSGSVGYSVNG